MPESGVHPFDEKGCFLLWGFRRILGPFLRRAPAGGLGWVELDDSRLGYCVGGLLGSAQELLLAVVLLPVLS